MLSSLEELVEVVSDPSAGGIIPLNEPRSRANPSRPPCAKAGKPPPVLPTMGDGDVGDSRTARRE